MLLRLISLHQITAMKQVLCSLFLLLSVFAKAQDIDAYFEKIRHNEAELTAFFSQMPKGGDLHNHYSGSVYAETYIEDVFSKNYYINTSTLQVVKSLPANADKKLWMQFSAIKDSGLIESYKEKLLQKWSVKDYNGVSYPSDKQFFETFGGFGIASGETQPQGLVELKERAKKENVSYIETMFTSIPCNSLKLIDTSYNHLLEQAQNSKDEAATTKLLDEIFQLAIKNGAKTCADDFNTYISGLHNSLHIDDATFTMRYQNYVVRTMQPLAVFRNLIVAFTSADASKLIVGVNIVAPEDNDTSMRDYWLHMHMFRYCHAKFPNVKYSMHAGELTLGIVKPEELTWHINAAVRIAGANRVGHGVDMAYEYHPYELLQYMAANKIPIEINLYSNEFILKVKGNEHPFKLYKDFGVPIVICTDDAGVLRSDLIHQYVLLAMRYPFIHYSDVKKFVYNSIKYSFIKEPGVKTFLKEKLDKDFELFEKQVLSLQ